MVWYGINISEIVACSYASYVTNRKSYILSYDAMYARSAILAIRPLVHPSCQEFVS